MMKKTVLVTGCSAGGMGAAIALDFAKQGHHVFATARTPSKIDADLSALSNVTVVALDVTDASSIAAAAEAVSEATSTTTTKTGESGRLDVLVNNAGLNLTRPILDTPPADGKALFDTNFWGPVAVCQAFAPALVAAGGVVVNISSVTAVMNTPYQAFYSASKAAMTAMSETLRLELAPLGVAVLTVAAGNVETRFWQKEVTTGTDDYRLPKGSLYGPVEDRVAVAASGKHAGSKMPAEDFARQIRVLALARSSGLVWRGTFAGMVRWAAKFMPTGMMDRALSDGRGLDELAVIRRESGKTKAE